VAVNSVRSNVPYNVPYNVLYIVPHNASYNAPYRLKPVLPNRIANFQHSFSPPLRRTPRPASVREFAHLGIATSTG
jgi:hypothetical protein